MLVAPRPPPLPSVKVRTVVAGQTPAARNDNARKDGVRLARVKAALEESARAHQQMVEVAPLYIASMADIVARSLRAGGKVLFCGNGGSAADSQHAAAELMGNYLIERRALSALALTTDTSVLTAVGNDIAYDEIFARQIIGLGRTGDVIVGLSTSGNSPNIIRALETAKEIGAYSLALTGSQGGALHSIADICLRVPSTETPRIQELHILALHSICDLVEQDFFAKPDSSTG